MWGPLEGPGSVAVAARAIFNAVTTVHQPVLPAISPLRSEGRVPSAWLLAWGASYRVLQRSF